MSTACKLCPQCGGIIPEPGSHVAGRMCQCELAAPPCSANFRVHDAIGNWMIEDRQMGRMIAMSTRERDAKFIAEALNAYSPNTKVSHEAGQKGSDEQ